MTKVRVREREQEVELTNAYERSIVRQQKIMERQMKGKVVVKEKDREWFLGRQGRLIFYLQEDSYSDHALRDWQVFKQDIRQHSGSHRHQGGLVIFCLEGKGYSVVDGVRHDWKEGDLILLPYKPGGVEHQHFNSEPGKPCKWIAFLYNPYWDMGASEVVQKQVSPEYNPK